MEEHSSGNTCHTQGERGSYSTILHGSFICDISQHVVIMGIQAAWHAELLQLQTHMVSLQRFTETLHWEVATLWRIS